METPALRRLAEQTKERWSFVRRDITQRLGMTEQELKHSLGPGVYDRWFKAHFEEVKDALDLEHFGRHMDEDSPTLKPATFITAADALLHFFGQKKG